MTKYVEPSQKPLPAVHDPGQGARRKGHSWSGRYRKDGSSRGEAGPPHRAVWVLKLELAVRQTRQAAENAYRASPEEAEAYRVGEAVKASVKRQGPRAALDHPPDSGSPAVRSAGPAGRSDRVQRPTGCEAATCGTVEVGGSGIRMAAPVRRPAGSDRIRRAIRPCPWLQRTVGNAAVTSLLERPTVQRSPAFGLARVGPTSGFAGEQPSPSGAPTPEKTLLDLGTELMKKANPTR